jgi:deoxyguanosine kinase
MQFIYNVFEFLWNYVKEWMDDVSLFEDPGVKQYFRIISIEGNIGSGKSTVLKALQDDEAEFLLSNNIVVVPEPVEKWEQLKDPNDGQSILTKFYKEPKRYAFLLQIFIIETMIETIETAIMNNPDMKILLCERSILTSSAVFSQLLLDLDYITKLEFQYLERLVMDYMHYFPDDVIFLDVPVDICMKRINKRNRDGESDITIQYLENWEKQCKRWLFDAECCHDEIETTLRIPYNESRLDFPFQVVKDVLVSQVGNFM